MGKGEMSNSSAEIIESSTLITKTTEASKMLEAALLQMDGIISGINLLTILFIIIF